MLGAWLAVCFLVEASFWEKLGVRGCFWEIGCFCWGLFFFGRIVLVKDIEK